MGAVCHTLNPRLTAAQIGAMLVQSEAGILLVSADLLPLAEAAARNVGTVRRILLLDADAAEIDAGEGAGRIAVGAREPAVAAASADIAWREFEGNSPCGPCFTSGTTGAPIGVHYRIGSAHTRIHHKNAQLE